MSRLSTSAKSPAVVIAVFVMAAMLGACGTQASELRREKVVIDRTTTTTGLPCDVVETAERAITEASFSATNADAAARAATDEWLVQLEQSLPPSLVGNVAALRATFERAWGGTEAGVDPFEAAEYVAADQEIRRYVDGGCAEPDG